MSLFSMWFIALLFLRGFWELIRWLPSTWRSLGKEWDNITKHYCDYYSFICCSFKCFVCLFVFYKLIKCLWLSQTHLEFKSVNKNTLWAPQIWGDTVLVTFQKPISCLQLSINAIKTSIWTLWKMGNENIRKSFCKYFIIGNNFPSLFPQEKKSKYLSEKAQIIMIRIG